MDKTGKYLKSADGYLARKALILRAFLTKVQNRNKLFACTNKAPGLILVGLCVLLRISCPLLLTEQIVLISCHYPRLLNENCSPFPVIVALKDKTITPAANFNLIHSVQCKSLGDSILSFVENPHLSSEYKYLETCV